MKKLLLIAVLALGVVACDKDELGMDMDGSSINVLTENKIDVKDGNNQAAFLDILVNTAKNYKGKKVSSSSTAKGTNYIILRAFTDNGQAYLHFGSEDAPELCNFPEIDGGIIYNLKDDNSLGLELYPAEVEVASIDGDWSFLFAVPFNSLHKTDANISVTADAVVSAEGTIFTFN